MLDGKYKFALQQLKMKDDYNLRFLIKAVTDQTSFSCLGFYT